MDQPPLSAPDFSLNGKVALLTAAGRGIGLGMARALASAGCAVAIQDIDLAVAEQEAQAIRDSGGRAVAIGGDMGEIDVVRGLIARTVSSLGGLHILINNAAIQKQKPWLEVTLEEMEQQWRVNMAAPILLSQEAALVFRAGGSGRIVNIGSIQQKVGNANMLPYSMSKAALENMTRALARDLAPQITVNLIAPGYVNTWRNREDARIASGPADPDNIKRWLPMARIGQPADFAGIVLLLCSDAGGYITGQSIFVDGGMSAR